MKSHAFPENWFVPDPIHLGSKLNLEYSTDLQAFMTSEKLVFFR